MNDSETTAGNGSAAKPRTAGRSGKRAGARPPGNRQPIELGILPDLVGYNLRCAHVALFQHFNRTVGASEISAPQFGTLLLIEANPGISQSAVAEALRFDRSTLVQIIDRLESRALVVREVSAHDRRSHALRLTADGTTLLAQLKQISAEHEAAMTDALDEAEKRQLIDLLTRIYTRKG